MAVFFVPVAFLLSSVLLPSNYEKKKKPTANPRAEYGCMRITIKYLDGDHLDENGAEELLLGYLHCRAQILFFFPYNSYVFPTMCKSTNELLLLHHEDVSVIVALLTPFLTLTA